MNLLFRLKKDIPNFYSIEDAKEFFTTILHNRDNNYFYHVKKLQQIEPNDIIYFAYDGYIVAKGVFTGEIFENFDRVGGGKYTQGHQLTNIQIINANKKLNYKIVSTRTKYLDNKDIIKEVYRVLNDKLDIYPDELNKDKDFSEGNSEKVYVNRYERDKKAREACLNHFGYNCQICEFNFEDTYGNIGRNSIHVHHIIPLHKIGKSYKVNPIKDLIPVCPNCHLILHKKNAPTIDKLKKYFKNKNRKRK